MKAGCDNPIHGVPAVGAAIRRMESYAMLSRSSDYRLAIPAIGLLRLPLDLFLGLHRAVRQWQWRGARPFAHLSDHLRRDVGLPPLDGRSSGY